MQEIPKHHNAFAYILDGEVFCGDKAGQRKSMHVFRP